MEKIWQAVERARVNFGEPKPRPQAFVAPSVIGPQFAELEINEGYLAAKRVVSHNGADQRSRPYDMLRTQVLQSMQQHGWKMLGVTSPTPGCGKTLTAVNLAFSIARQEDQSVALVDMDLQKPQVANSVGIIPANRGVLDILEGRTALQDAMIWVRAGNRRIVVLPTAPTKELSERMGSRAMRTLLQDIKRDHQIVLLDLPPMLSSDDVISILPQIDCVLLVAAMGQSKASEVEESIRHLNSSPLVRLVLNKATDDLSNYYYQGY